MSLLPLARCLLAVVGVVFQQASATRPDVKKHGRTQEDAAVMSVRRDDCTLDIDEVTMVQDIPAKVLNPTEAARTYSSQNGDQASQLDSDAAWTPSGDESSDGTWSANSDDPAPWMMIDLGQQELIAGIVMQRHALEQQWVKEYEVALSSDQKEWVSVMDKDLKMEQFIGVDDAQKLEVADDGLMAEVDDASTQYGTLFGGEFDEYAPLSAATKHATTTEARYVKITPTKWQGKPSCRVGVLIACTSGCLAGRLPEGELPML